MLLDRLTITVLAENSVPHKSPLLGQHGVSFWLEAERGETVRRILVDVGQNPEALLFNVEKLGIPLGKTDAIVMTHCHYDHTQGLAQILQAIAKRDIPIIAHPEFFRLNFITDPFFQHRGVGQSDKAENLEAAGAKLVLVADPLQLMPGLSTTGEIPRVTDFEKEGLVRFTTDKKGKIVPDLMRDDLSLVAKVKNKGVIIVTGCSHAGIINILKHSVKPGEKLLGIIGGLHLVDAKNERIEKTISAMNDFSPMLVAAGHCTGTKAQMAILSSFGERATTMGPGTKFQF